MIRSHRSTARDSARCSLHSALSWLVLATLILPSVAQPSQTLFDGHSLAGWVHRGGATFTVRDGVLSSSNAADSDGWLCTTKEYGDFTLEADVNADRAALSCLQFRSHIDDKDKMTGLQVAIDGTDRAWSGALYDQGRRGWLKTLDGNDAARQAFQIGQWNHLKLDCDGDRIQVWINGVPTVDYVDSMDLQGVIALQARAGQQGRVSWRNIQIQDRGRRSWKRIWDGQTLNGWHAIGKGEWLVQNGAILGRHLAIEPEFGHLVSDAVYHDLTVRVQYFAVAGNSGLYFLSVEKGWSGITGFQAEIDPVRDAGGLYETNGRQWVVRPTLDQVATWYKKNDWNTMTISAHGRRLVVDVNGKHSAEFANDHDEPAGHLALQLHGGQDVQVMFKDLEVLSDPPPAG